MPAYIDVSPLLVRKSFNFMAYISLVIAGTRPFLLLHALLARSLLP